MNVHLKMTEGTDSEGKRWWNLWSEKGRILGTFKTLFEVYQFCGDHDHKLRHPNHPNDTDEKRKAGEEQARQRCDQYYLQEKLRARMKADGEVKYGWSTHAWVIDVPCDVASALTRDNAPRLEAALKQAFEVLRNWRKS